MTGFKAHHNLALIYQDMGRWAAAESHWQAALQDNARFVPSWLGLGEAYLRDHRFAEARAVLERIEALAPAAAAPLQRRLTAQASVAAWPD